MLKEIIKYKATNLMEDLTGGGEVKGKVYGRVHIICGDEVGQGRAV